MPRPATAIPQFGHPGQECNTREEFCKHQFRARSSDQTTASSAQPWRQVGRTLEVASVCNRCI